MMEQILKRVSIKEGDTIRIRFCRTGGILDSISTPIEGTVVNTNPLIIDVDGNKLLVLGNDEILESE